MKLGLLQCDEVLPVFLPIDGDYPAMITWLLGDRAREVELAVFRCDLGELPPDADACDAYIGGGSRASVFEKLNWIARLEEFVRELHAREKKFVGICFSHQMITQALGGKVERSDRGWGIGVKTMTLTCTQPWMQPPLDEVRTLFSHQDQVTELPPEAKLLGGNDHCPNGLYTVGDHFLSIQAHPEYTPEFVRALIESRREIIPPETFEPALAGLGVEPQQELLGQWVQQFLLG